MANPPATPQPSNSAHDDRVQSYTRPALPTLPAGFSAPTLHILLDRYDVNNIGAGGAFEYTSFDIPFVGNKQGDTFLDGLVITLPFPRWYDGRFDAIPGVRVVGVCVYQAGEVLEPPGGRCNTRNVWFSTIPPGVWMSMGDFLNFTTLKGWMMNPAMMNIARLREAIFSQV